MTHIPAYLIGFALTIVLVMVLRKPAHVIGLVDIPGGRKQHETPIPLIGGIAMFLGFTAPIAFLWPFPAEPYGSLVVGMAALVAVGILDDLYETRRSLRVLLQLAATCVMVWWGGVQIHSLGNIFGAGQLELGIFAAPFTLLCMVGLINAVNMTDGFDGLAGGVVMIALIWLGVVAAVSGINGYSVPMLILLACAIAGFLVFNLRNPWRRKASVFMGDTGSLMLGFALGWFAVYISQSDTAYVPPMTIAWILALPIFDTITVIIRRIGRGVSPFKPARDHAHHILLDAGISGTTTTYALIGAGAVCGGVGVGGWLLGVPEPAMFVGFVAAGFGHLWFSAKGWKFIRALSR